MVFYRKYRPQTIDELDSASVRETLSTVLAKGTTHAFLFTGPKGLGKTSTARIVAKSVNCVGRQSTVNTQPSTKKETNKLKVESGELKVSSIEPCNTCEQCLSITNGTNLDVFEIDAASNRGIDEIRELKEKINLSPLQAKKKIYIIDEVHMLTTEAFNALLKTLEEPPSHALFILCTTEDQKVPETILSRCFHISFLPATKEELIRSFQRIAKSEGLIVDVETLGMIADLADGGFRDGAKIMEELSFFAKNKQITKALVEEKYQIEKNRVLVMELLTYLHTKNVKPALQLVSGLSKKNISASFFLQEVVASLHTLLLSLYGVVDTKLDMATIPFSGEELQHLLTLFSEVGAEIKYAVIPTLPLELAVLTWCSDTLPTTDQVTKTESIETSNVGKMANREDENVTVTSLRKQVGNMAKIKALYGEEKKEVVVTSPDEGVVSILDFSADGEITSAWLNAFWKALIAEMKQYNHTLAGILRGCMIKSFDRKSLVLETAYKFHKEKLDEGKTMQTLEQVCKKLTGKPVTIAIVLKSN